MFPARLTVQAMLRIGQRLQARALNSGATDLAEAIGPILEFRQRPPNLLQRSLNLALQRYSHSLIKGIGGIVSDVIAVANAIVFGGFEPLQLLFEFRVFF
jgi:hypothetical protein